MTLQLALAVAAILVAVSGAIALAHVVRWPARRGLSLVPALRAQRAVRRYGVYLGIIEVGALIALLVVLFKVPAGSTEMWLAGGAALCVAAMIGVWAAWLRPLNTTIARWAPDALPADWSHHHSGWSRSHRLRVVLAVIAMALVLMGLFARPAI